MRGKSLGLRMGLAVSLFAAFSGLVLPGQQPAEIQIDFTNEQLVPSHWTLKFTPDGNGQFDAEGGHPAKDDANTIWAGDVHRPVQLSPAFAEQVFATARMRKLFDFPCESHMKVAFEGWKTLTYTGPAGQGACTFNYSRDKEIQTLGESMQAVAETILEGARFEVLLQHDRLGLDQEMEYFTEAVQDGRAQQVYAIRDILERLAQDDGVLERVRKQARDLLAHAAT